MMVFPMTEETVKRTAITWCREAGHDPEKDKDALQEAETLIGAMNKMYQKGYAAGVATTLEANKAVQTGVTI